jgi:hypothetical protein
MLQNFGGYNVDMLTAKELRHELQNRYAVEVQERFRGQKLFRLPVTRVTASTGTTNTGEGPEADPPGPQQGFLWRISRIMVASSSLSDNAKYVVYAGSDSTAIDSAHLLDGQVAPVPSVSTVVTPAVPASATAQYNNNPQGVLVTVSGGTVSQITVNGTVTGLTSGGIYVPAYGTIAVTYSVAPTWSWAAAIGATVIGQNVNLAFRPGNKAEWIFPGEFVYANIQNTTPQNVYTLTGIATEAPMEMMGKLL